MKRMVFWLLTIMMIITLFVACGKEETEFKKLVNQIEEGMYAHTNVKEIMGEPIGINGPTYGTEWWLYESDEGEGVTITFEYIDSLLTVTKINYRNSEEWAQFKELDVGKEFLADFRYNETVAAERATEFEKQLNQIEDDMLENEVKAILGEPIAVFDRGEGAWWLYESDEGEGATISMALTDDIYIVAFTVYYNSINWTEFKESHDGKKFLSNFTYTG